MLVLTEYTAMSKEKKRTHINAVSRSCCLIIRIFKGLRRMSRQEAQFAL